MNRILKRTAALAMSVLMTMGAVNTMAAEKASKFFTDVNENSYGWAIDYVDYIASKGIASGVGDNKYAPGNTIERGDFVVFLSKVFDLKDADDFMFSFKDVPSDSYYCDAIANAKGAGIITETNMFYPENYITRIDAMTMLYRALSNGNYIGSIGTTNISMYSDAAEVKSIEQQAAIGTLTIMGIVQGSDGMLKPNDTMSRAEMAVVIAKAAQKVEAAKEEAAKPVEKTEEEIKEEEQKEEEQKEENKAEESKNYIGEDIAEPIVIQHGGSVEISNSNVKTDGETAVALSNDSTVNVSNSKISSTKASAITIDEGEVTLDNSDVTGNDGIAVQAFKDGIITVNGGKISSTGKADTISIKDSVLKLDSAEVTADKNKTAIAAGEATDIEIKDSTLKTNSAAGEGSYAGVFALISDPENRDEITIDIEDSTLDNSRGSIFYLRESIATINLNGGNIIKCAKFISSPFDRKNVQKEGNSITLNLKNKQKIEDTEIELDSKSSLAIHIDSGCSFTGRINSNASSDDVDLFIDRDGLIELTGDIYIDQFDNGEDYDFDNIIDNGWNIYYNVGNSENDYLRSNTYDLLNGGRLQPNR